MAALSNTGTLVWPRPSWPSHITNLKALTIKHILSQNIRRHLEYTQKHSSRPCSSLFDVINLKDPAQTGHQSNIPLMKSMNMLVCLLKERQMVRYSSIDFLNRVRLDLARCCLPTPSSIVTSVSFKHLASSISNATVKFGVLQPATVDLVYARGWKKVAANLFGPTNVYLVL